MQIIQEITLDVDSTVNYQYVEAKQYDNASRFLQITLMAGKKEIVPKSDETAIFRCLKQDGTSCINQAVINPDGTITAELTNQVLAVEGTVRADISLINGEAVLSTASFFITVGAVPATANSAVSSNEFLLLIEKTKEAAKVINEINTKLQNGDFNGADGVSPTVSVKKIDGGNRVTVTGAEGSKSFDVLDGEPYELTNEDIQKIKSAALGDVTKVADDLKKRADDGEFNGKDYIITPADKQEIAEQAAELAGAMQGGTVTYKIPKEYYHTDFGDDPNRGSDLNLNLFTIYFGKAILNVKQYMEDVEAGIVELLPTNRSLSTEEQKIYEKYISFDVKPWVPTPRVSLFDLLTTGILENNGQSTMYLNKIWNNDFKVSIHAENSNGETAYSCIKSDIVHSAEWSNILSVNGFVPYLSAKTDYDENTGIQTTELWLIGTGAAMRYGSAMIGYTSYVTNNDVKEVSITFIPNNTVVEEYEDE